jgi:hypothetical protein
MRLLRFYLDDSHADASQLHVSLQGAHSRPDTTKIGKWDKINKNEYE